MSFFLYNHKEKFHETQTLGEGQTSNLDFNSSEIDKLKNDDAFFLEKNFIIGTWGSALHWSAIFVPDKGEKSE